MLRVSSIFLFFDRYCSTVQGLLDWFEVDLGFTSFCLFRLSDVACEQHFTVIVMFQQSDLTV